MITEKINKVVNWKEYLVPNDENPRVERFLNSKGVRVYSSLVDSISEAIKMNVEKLHVLVHPNVTGIVIIKPRDYLDILKHALAFLKTKEEYEMCAKTLKVVEQVRKLRLEKIDKMKNMIDSIESGESK